MNRWWSRGCCGADIVANLTVGMKGKVSKKIYNCLDLCLEGLYRQAATCLKKSDSWFSISCASIFDASKPIAPLFPCLKLREKNQYPQNPQQPLPKPNSLKLNYVTCCVNGLRPFLFPPIYLNQTSQAGPRTEKCAAAPEHTGGILPRFWSSSAVLLLTLKLRQSCVKSQIGIIWPNRFLMLQSIPGVLYPIIFFKCIMSSNVWGNAKLYSSVLASSALKCLCIGFVYVFLWPFILPTIFR